ncbi:MAG: hypothetical protein K9H61_07150 [Bacteroidia bacterium]|nr:hypothetical protein [Bacteroidia bacterium]MCF8426586.1 hypothetical protein [Bacteroidia bacterium]MCF8446756.1 hypothetical protein [Bacteroidia bacterium]
MFRKIFFLVTSGLLFGLRVFAQLPNEVISDKITIHEQDSGRFGFSIINTNYMRNTEYFNPIEEGRTLFGYQLQPKFSYQPARNIKLEAGVWLRHDFGGDNPFTTAIPTFSLKAKGKKSELIFGTLEGALSHGMLEPMMNIASVIDKRIENGFEYKKTVENGGSMDLWINWENFIQPNEFDKERFSAGMHVRAVLRKKEKDKLEMYVQWIASHQGGQIDKDTINPFMMQFNTAMGLRYERKLTGKVKSIYADLAMLDYIETSDSKVYPKDMGNGFMGNLGAVVGSTNFMLSYWNAKDYIAPRGTYIYQSVSTVDAKNYEKNRQLLFFRVIQNKALFHSPIIASARFEPVYDLNNGIFDFSYSLYLVYRGDFRFGKK